MTNTALVQVKVDLATKTDVTSIYESLGLDLPTAVRIFFKKSIAVGGLPVELRNDTELDLIENSGKYTSYITDRLLDYLSCVMV